MLQANPEPSTQNPLVASLVTLRVSGSGLKGAELGRALDSVVP